MPERPSRMLLEQELLRANRAVEQGRELGRPTADIRKELTAEITELEKLKSTTGTTGAEFLKTTAKINALGSELRLSAQYFDRVHDAQMRFLEGGRKYLTWVHSAVEGTRSVSHEQADYLIGTERLAQQTTVAGKSFQTQVDQLDRFRSSLVLTRKETLDFGGALRDSLVRGVSGENLEHLTRKLQDLRGHSEGLDLGKKIAGSLDEVDRRIAERGDLKSVQQRSRALGGEAGGLLVTATQAYANKGPGVAQQFTESEARVESFQDMTRELMGSAGIGGVTTALDFYMPVVTGTLEKILSGIIALKTIQAGGSLLGGASTLVGGGAGTAGLLGKFGAGASRMLGLSGLGFGVASLGFDYLGDKVENEPAKQGLKNAARTSRVAGFGLTGAAIGSAIAPGVGTLALGAIGTGLGFGLNYFSNAETPVSGVRPPPTPNQPPRRGQRAPSGVDAVDVYGEAADRLSEHLDAFRTGVKKGTPQEAARLAESRLDITTQGGGDLTEILRTRRAGLEEETRLQRQDISAQREVITKQRTEIAPEVAAGDQSAILKDQTLRESLHRLDRSFQELINENLENYIGNLEKLANRVEKSAAFIASQGRSELIGARFEFAVERGVSPVQARSLLGERTAEAKTRLGMLEGSRDTTLASMATEHKKKIEEADNRGASAEEKRLIQEEFLIKQSRVLTDIEKARVEVLHSAISAVSQVADLERNLLSVRGAGIEAQRDISEFVGASFQQQLAVQQQIVNLKAQELKITEDELARIRASGEISAANQAKVQDLEKQRIAQATDLFKSAVGLQKDMISKLLGEQFGVGGGTKFQPGLGNQAFANRLIFGEHSLFAGQVIKGTAPLEEQRRHLQRGALEGLMGPGAGRPGPGQRPQRGGVPAGLASGGRVRSDSTDADGFWSPHEDFWKPRGTDTVPAMLTVDEHVTNAMSARANRSLLERIDAARGPLYLDRGGPVVNIRDTQTPGKPPRGQEHRVSPHTAPRYLAGGGAVAAFAPVNLQFSSSTQVRTIETEIHLAREKLKTILKSHPEDSFYTRETVQEANRHEHALDRMTREIQHLDRDGDLKSNGRDLFVQLLRADRGAKRNDPRFQKTNVDRADVSFDLDPEPAHARKAATAKSAHEVRLREIDAGTERVMRDMANFRRSQQAFARSPEGVKHQAARTAFQEALKTQERDRVRRHARMEPPPERTPHEIELERPVVRKQDPARVLRNEIDNIAAGVNPKQGLEVPPPEPRRPPPIGFDPARLKGPVPRDRGGDEDERKLDLQRKIRLQIENQKEKDRGRQDDFRREIFRPVVQDQDRLVANRQMAIRDQAGIDLPRPRADLEPVRNLRNPRPGTVEARIARGIARTRGLHAAHQIRVKTDLAAKQRKRFPRLADEKRMDHPPAPLVQAPRAIPRLDAAEHNIPIALPRPARLPAPPLTAPVAAAPAQQAAAAMVGGAAGKMQMIPVQFEIKVNFNNPMFRNEVIKISKEVAVMRKG